MSNLDEKAIERDFCAGVLSQQGVADKYGITFKALRYMAKKNGWVRKKLTAAEKKKLGVVSGQKAGAKTGAKKTEKCPKKNSQKLPLHEPHEYDDRKPISGSDKNASEFDELSACGLSERELIFVEEVHSGKKYVQAFINAGYEGNPKTAYKEASRLVRKPHIQKALRILKTQLRTSYQAERDEIVQQLVAITRADPNRITQHRRVNCRYCWGEYHFYQWRDAAEFEEKKLEALARKRKEPSDAGGYGFESGLAPNPECPRCSGEGLGELHICDTNDLDVNEHTYFLGVKQTKNGIEVLTESKQIARAQLLKILELDKAPVCGTTGKRGATDYSPEDYREAVARMEDEFKDLD